jgi:hypothetical protein
MAITGTDETGLTTDNDYYFRYNIDSGGWVESSINPDLIVGQKEDTLIETVADVSGSLSGKYFYINSPTTEYYVWLNQDSLSTDPAPVGKTGIEVLYNQNDDASTISSLVLGALDLNADFYSNSTTGTQEETVITLYKGTSSIHGKYFTFDTPDGSGWYVWWDDPVPHLDPALAGRTGIHATVSSNPDISSAVNTAVNAINASAAPATSSTIEASTPFTGLIILCDNVGSVIDSTSTLIEPSATTTTPGDGSTAQVSQINNVYLAEEIVYDGTYFTFAVKDSDGGGTIQYYVWHNFDGLQTDPSVPGMTGIEAIDDGTYTNWGDKVKAAIDGSPASSYCSVVAALNTKNELDYITITNTYLGAVDDATTGNMRKTVDVAIQGADSVNTITCTDKGIVDDATDVDTGFTITTLTQGTNDVSATTWDDIIIKLNSATTGGTWSIYQGDVRLTSNSTGPNATVRLGSGLSGDNLFTNLTGFTTFDLPKDPYPA